MNRKTGIFLEVVQGCLNRCHLDCEAPRQDPKIMDVEMVAALFPSLWEYSRTHSIIMFGVGDSSLFDWSSFNRIFFNTCLDNFRTNLRIGDYKRILKDGPFPPGFEVYINLFSIEDVEELNDIKDPNVFGKMVVCWNIPWMKMMALSRKPILISSLEPIASKYFIDQVEFCFLVRTYLGENLGYQIQHHASKNGCKMAIESIMGRGPGHTLKLRIRRCFWLDSEKKEFLFDRFSNIVFASSCFDKCSIDCYNSHSHKWELFWEKEKKS